MENSALAYIRVSTADQENSLEVQQKAIIEYAKFRNLTITQIIVDEDVSGGTELFKRKGGSIIKSAAEKNIIVVKPDRLFRNTIDALTTTDFWNKKDIALHIVDMAGASISTKTAIGRFLFTTVISYAEFEKNVTSERTKAVLNNKKSQGKTYSRPILGFDSVQGQMIPNTKEQLIITIIKNLSKSGHKPTFIAEFLNQKGHRTKNNCSFKPGTVNYIIKNPIYN